MESRQQINQLSTQFMTGLPLLAAGTAGFYFKDEISNLFNKNKQFFNFSFAHSHSSLSSGGFQKSFTNDFYSKKNFIHQDNILNKFGANKQFFSAANAAAASTTTSGGEAPKRNLILEKKLFISELTEGNTAMTQTYKEKINQLIQENIRQYKDAQKYDRLQVMDQNAISAQDAIVPEEIKAETKVFSAGVRQHRVGADFEVVQFQKVKKNIGNKKMYEFEKYLKQHFSLYPRNSKVRDRLFSKPLFWDFVDEWLNLQFKNYSKVAITPEFKMKPRIFQPVFFTCEFIFKLSGKKK